MVTALNKWKNQKETHVGLNLASFQVMSAVFEKSRPNGTVIDP